jgi:hypothetical protein
MVREKALRVSEVQAKFDQIRKMQPSELKTALRILNIEDAVIGKMESTLQDVVVKEAGLEASGVLEKDSRRKALRAQRKSILETFANAMDSVKQSQLALLEIERRTLEDLQKRLQMSRDKVAQDKQRVAGYAAAKARYLNEKKIYEAGQLKYSTERIDRLIDPPMPSAR